jgi:hypothetical protein
MQARDKRERLRTEDMRHISGNVADDLNPI